MSSSTKIGAVDPDAKTSRHSLQIRLCDEDWDALGENAGDLARAKYARHVLRVNGAFQRKDEQR